MLNTRSQSVLQERDGQALRVNIPAPYGGLNTRDSESNMESTDAVVLENFIPQQGSVKSRNGFTAYCTGLTGNVETLIEHFSSATRKFLACHNNQITDITNPLSINVLGSGYTNNKWQQIGRAHV